MKSVGDQTTRPPKRRRTRKALLLGLFVVLAVVGGEWFWRQVQFSRLRVPLIKAVEAGDTEEVRDLLEQGADPDIRMDYRSDPAIWRTFLQMLRGQRTDKAFDGKTVLMEASSRNQIEIVRALLNHGANTDLIGRVELRWKALHWAAREGSVESMRLLIAHGAQVDAQSSREDSPLFSAIAGDEIGEYNGRAGKDFRCVDLLLLHGADVNVRGEGGETPLMFAAEMPSYSDLCCLLDHGAYVNARDNNGQTALMYAARSETPASIQRLTKQGAELDLQDNTGKTALYFSVNAGRYHALTQSKTGYVGVIRALLACGADPNIRDINGDTPLLVAKGLGDKEVVALLRKAAVRARGAGRTAGR